MIDKRRFKILECQKVQYNSEIDDKGLSKNDTFFLGFCAIGTIVHFAIAAINGNVEPVNLSAYAGYFPINVSATLFVNLVEKIVDLTSLDVIFDDISSQLDLLGINENSESRGRSI